MADYPWLKNYDKDVPLTLEPYPERTLLDVAGETARLRPGHLMMWFKGNRISCAEFMKHVETLARALAALGVKKGDRVALLMPNTPQMIISQFAVWRAGGVAVPVNPLYSEAELVHALKECGAGIAIVLTPFYGLLKNVQAKTDVRTVVATVVKEYLSPVTRLIFGLFMEKKGGHRVALQPGDLWLQDIMKKYAASPLPDVKPSVKDTGLILFSGGTTGTPKGVMLSHESIVMNGMQIRSWFSTLLTDWTDTTVLLMPLFHIYGNVILVSTLVHARVPIVLVPNPRDVADLLKTIKATKPKFFPGIAALFIGLMNHPDVKSGAVDFKSMKMCVAAAAPLLPETKKGWEALTGGKLVEAYGLTESGVIAMGPILGTWKEGAVGLPTPDTVVKIVDIEYRDEGARHGGNRRDHREGPAADAGILEPARGHGGDDARRLAVHGRRRLPGRRRVPVHHVAEEGADQAERPPGVPGRGRGCHNEAPRGDGGGSGRRPRRGPGRGGQGMGGAEAGNDLHRRGTAGLLQGAADGVQGAEAHRVPRRAAEVAYREGPAPRTPGRGGGEEIRRRCFCRPLPQFLQGHPRDPGIARRNHPHDPGIVAVDGARIAADK